MPIVVTGSAGFIGSVLVGTLLDRGHAVVGVDRRRSCVSYGPGFVELTADLLDRNPAVADALAGADAVVHLAGCPGVRDPRPDVHVHRHRDNVLATAAVLAAVPPATPVVVATSSSVYGGSYGGRPCAEDDPLRPAGGYAQSKARAEALCAARLAAGGRVAVARPFTVVGEGQRPDMALSLWLADAAAGRPLRILGSPDRTRDVTDVRDVARVLLAFVERGVTGPVNVGTGVPRRLGELAAAVGVALGVDVATEVVPASAEEVPDTLADTRRLRELVGFVPETDLADVLRRQVAGLAAAGGSAAEPAVA